MVGCSEAPNLPDSMCYMVPIIQTKDLHSATSTSFPVRLVEFFFSSWPLLSPKENLVSPEDFLPRKGSSEGLGKGDLQSGPAGAANAELVIERLVLGRAEDGRYLQPWPD